MWTTIILLGMLSRRSFSYVQTTTSRRLSTILKPLCASSDVTTAYTNEKKNICVVGGGFGGVYTALKLGNMFKDKKNVEITLLDPKDKFVFLPLLYELAIGSASVVEVCPRYDALLKDSNVKFVRGYVNEVDIKNNEMKVTSTVKSPTDMSSSSSSYTMKYDQLVMAVGAQPRLDLAPGMKEFALPFYRVEDAYELKLRLRALMDSKKPVVRVVVLGGGYSGVEVATSVAQYIGQDRAIVTIVDKNDRIMQRAPDNNRNAAHNVLSKLGISVNCNTIATAVSENTVTVQEKTEQGSTQQYDLDADLVLVTLGMELSPLIKNLPLPKDKLGRLLTDRTLQSKGKANVFVLGDCSGIADEFVPSTAQVAMQQADIVAKNVAFRAIHYDVAEDLWDKTSRPGELEKFRYVPLGEMLTLGNARGAITSMGGLVRLQGPLAAIGRRIVYAARMPTRTQQASALVNAGASELSLLRDRLMKKIPFGSKR